MSDMVRFGGVFIHIVLLFYLLYTVALDRANSARLKTNRVFVRTDAQIRVSIAALQKLPNGSLMWLARSDTTLAELRKEAEAAKIVARRTLRLVDLPNIFKRRPPRWY